ncbi:MAG: FAD:protein FMN transferase [Candidatus Omnitrophica bacterium]|nr:FAD:protein FMN transferase [Candidatus Omnitrophota bacterium]
MKIKILIIISIVLCISIGIGYSFFYRRPLERRADIIMGTVCEITLIDKDKGRRHEAFESAFRILRGIENSMSVFDEGSELNRINTSAFHKPVYVSSDLMFVVEKSIFFSTLTKGTFDITVFPLTELWNAARQRETIPTPDAIKKCMETIGYENIVVSENARGRQFVRFKKVGTKIDVGGIAKGYACDLVVASLKGRGITRALVNIGGTIFAFGKPLGKTQWSIGVRDPRSEEKMIKTIFLNEQAISTSGDYEQFFVHEGKRYSHILDPRSGHPADQVISVSVIAPSAMVADALSTSFFVLGIEQGMILATKLQKVETLFIYEKDAIQEITHTEGFPLIP